MCKVNLIKKSRKNAELYFIWTAKEYKNMGLQPMGIIWLQFHILNPLKSEVNLHYIYTRIRFGSYLTKHSL